MAVDYSKAKALREKRHDLAKQIRTMADKVNEEKRDFTAEERTAWTAVNDEYNSLTHQITTAERAAEVQAQQEERQEREERAGREDFTGGRQNLPRPATEEERSLAIKAWCRVQSGLDVDERMQEAASKSGVSLRYNSELVLRLEPDYRQIDRKLRESRAMSLTVGSGGYTVPQGFMNSLEMAMLAYGYVRQVSDIIRTETGNTIPWPTVNDTGNSGVLLAENTTIGSSVDPTFSVVNLNAYKFSSQLVLASEEIMQDSAFDLATWLGEALGIRLGRIQNSYFTTGTGSSQPQGLTVGGSLGKTAASATAIAADELIDLFHSVDPAYRTDPSFGFMMNDAIMAAIRKLKDSQNRYLFQENLIVGQPDTLLGRQVTLNQNMASTIATTNKTVLAGAFKKYKIREVAEIRVRRLVERYADTDQQGFIAFMRSDGKVMTAGVNPIKWLAQA